MDLNQNDYIMQTKQDTNCLKPRDTLEPNLLNVYKSLKTKSKEISVRIFDRILGWTGSVNGSRGGVPVSLPKVMEQGVTGATREIRARHTEMTLLGMTPSHPWCEVTTGARTTLG